MTNEMKTYIDISISYMNQCRRMLIDMMKYKDFSESDYGQICIGCTTLYVVISDLVETFGMEVIKDEDGFYSVM